MDFKRRFKSNTYIQQFKIYGELAILLLMLAAFLNLFSAVQSTYALFTDEAETESILFRATTFADNLTITPGKAMTNNSPSEPGPAFRVAQFVDGNIVLDFGTYPVGNNREFPNTLIVENISDRIITLSWRFEGCIKGYFFESSGIHSIRQGEYAELGFEIDSKPSDQAGDYSGTLILTAFDGFISWEIPARLNLVEGRKKAENEKKNEKNADNIEKKDIAESLKMEENETGTYEASSPDEADVIAGEEASSPDEADVTAGEEASSPDEEEVTAGEEASSSDEEEVTVDEEASLPDEEEVTVGEEEISPVEEDVTAGEEVSLPVEEDVTAGEEEISPDEEEVSVGEEESSPVEEDVTAGEEVSLPVKEDVTAGEEVSLPVEEEVTVGEEVSLPVEDKGGNDDEEQN